MFFFYPYFFTIEIKILKLYQNKLTSKNKYPMKQYFLLNLVINLGKDLYNHQF